MANQSHSFDFPVPVDNQGGKVKFRRIAASLLFICAACAPTTHQAADQLQRWAAYYDSKLPADAFKDNDLVVFDRRYHPDFRSLQPDTVVLAYISIGEVYDDVAEKDMLEKAGALKGKDEAWNSHVVNIAAPEWKAVVLDQVNDAVKNGFDGVMLDTVDRPLSLAHGADEQKMAQAAAVSLIKDIRASHPYMKIMLNRGFDILPKAAPYLDYALAESTLAQTDVSTGQSKLYPPNSYNLAVSRLKEARQVAPQLKIYTLDYWNQDDVHGLRKIYATQRAQGFSPYVSTPDLRSYTPEPTGLHLNAINEPSLKEHHDA